MQLPDWTYTGVGSRETPEGILQLMQHIGTANADLGIHLRSGAAPGSDSAFEQGVLTSQFNGNMEIYLANALIAARWKRPLNDIYLDASTFENYQEAINIAERIHPAWHYCSDWARAMHSRNPYQVLGRDLNSPSDAIVYWATPTADGSVKGGTRTAVMLAREYNVPECNLYYPRNVELFENYVMESSLEYWGDLLKILRKESMLWKSGVKS